MNFLHWISGSARRRDCRRRQERRRLPRRRHDIDVADEGHYYDNEYDPETYWTGGTPYADAYSYQCESPFSTAEQEPRVIFVNPGPEYVARQDQETEDYRYHGRHRRHHRKRRHERAYSLPPDMETQSCTSYEYIPEDWYRQQYYPPIADPQPSYDSNRRRRYSYRGETDVGTYGRSYSHTPPSLHTHATYDGMPDVVSVGPRITTSTSRKVDTTPIYDTDVQRALEESYAQAELDRQEERRRERRRQREFDRESIATDADWGHQRQNSYDNMAEEERRGRTRRIAELEAEIQVKELQRELRYRKEDRDRDLDRDSRPESRRQRSYCSASLSGADSLASRLDGFDLRGDTHSPAPSSSSRQERERYVGSLGGSSWTGQGHEAGTAGRRETEDEDYHLRPRVRFSPAVSYERDFVRRPRVYYSPADLENHYRVGGEDYRHG